MPGLVVRRNTENEEMSKVLFEERKMNYFNDFQNIMVDNCLCSACKYLRRKPASGRSKLINDMDIESKTISKPDYSTQEQVKHRKIFRSKSLDLSLDPDALSTEKPFGSISFDLLKKMIHCFKLNLLLTNTHFGLENCPHKYTLKSLAQAKLLELERKCSNSFEDNSCSYSGTFQSEKNCVDEPFKDYKIGFVDEIREDDSDGFQDDTKNCLGNKDSSSDSDNSWNIWNGNTIQLKIPGSSEENSKRKLPRMSYQYLLFSRGNYSARSKFFKYFTETKGFLGHTGNSCLCCSEGRKKPLYQR